METHVNASLINGEKYVFDTRAGEERVAAWWIVRVVCKH
jgi:hypothetical protein